MDKDAIKLQLEGEMDQIRGYLDHPITKRIFADNDEQQEALVKIICDFPIMDLESFFKHFESVGHLRGLRRAKAIVTSELERIEQEIEEL
jgi:hypothetical protein